MTAHHETVPSPLPYLDDGDVTVYLADCFDAMRQMPAESVDAIVTDPPYGLEFMGKEWDSFGRDTGPGYREKPRFTSDHMGKGFDKIPNSYQAGRPFQSWCEAWGREALRVAKPGAHLAAFGGTRTYHRLTCGLEDAGWEIRDGVAAWLYGSGFPKSKNLDGDWQGWGTALKPAWEPIVLARKPLAGTVAANVLRHGTGALNIDACRIEGGERSAIVSDRRSGNVAYGDGLQGSRAAGTTDVGRWPANVVLDEDAAALLDEHTGDLAPGASPPKRGLGYGSNARGVDKPREQLDGGGASRFFYTAKADAEERQAPDGTRNTHPTVKPTDLMRWLVRLIVPPGGVVLDPFAGSGSTGVACRAESVRCVLVEREAEYAAIIAARLAQQTLL